ncbi:methyltransferase [Lentzea sp. NBRC 105346]|uniref:methyltransferase n=1 Tax=Lentzea sp. NBRC 105346 TaxID=3032205 RepID=UPI00255358AA|nr:methyltransferase [Lentzea sp. NBRC 105346]
MAGLATPMSLRVAVTLRLPDRLLDSDATADELAAELDLNPGALDLLLAHLATLGIVERTGVGYRTTALGANLTADADNGLAGLLDVNTAAGRADLAFVELAHSVRTGEAAYPQRYGQGFWEDLAEHPHLRESFDRQMTHRFRAEIPRFVAGFDWSRFESIVDVGGGQGDLLAAILAAHPHVRGHLLDLEPPAEFGEHERAQVTAGSFFDPLPANADAYLLVDILHNWDDEHAHRILARCAETGGRVLVIESVRPYTGFSLVMLIMFGGRDRTVDEYRALAEQHGLVLDGVTELTEQRSLLEFRKG